MAKPKETTGRDYGHRLYMDAGDYTESIMRPSDKQFDDRVQRPHSDDKKPYMGDEYPEMEYYWTPYDPPHLVPPGFPDDPRLPPNYPDIPWRPDDPDVPHEFYGCVFGIPQGPMFIAPGDTTFAGIGLEYNDLLTDLRVLYGPVKLISTPQSVNGCTLGPYPNCSVHLQALEEFDPEDYQAWNGYYPSQIQATTKSGQKCWLDVWVKVCPASPALAWDRENSAETIGVHTTVVVSIVGGAPPFLWTVSGDDYDMVNYKTNSRTNALYAGWSSCGPAVITVTDDCGDTVIGVVRSTAGWWQSLGHICQISEGGTWVATYVPSGGTWRLDIEIIEGQYKQQQAVSHGLGVGTSQYATEAACEAGLAAINWGSWTTPCVDMPASIVMAGHLLTWRPGTPILASANCILDSGNWKYWSYFIDSEIGDCTAWQWSCL